MKINNIFYSIQGEGPSTGLPSTFIRLSGCNLRCIWCDTSYSWEEGTEYTVDQILQEIEQLDCKRIVITGGEPFCQDLGELLIWLKKLGYFVEIETNGTIVSPYEHLVDHLVISPKLPSAGYEPEFYKVFELCRLYNSTLKVVIGDETDYDYLIKYRHCFNDAPLYIQLESKEEINKELADKIIKRFMEDYKDSERFDKYTTRISIQLHKVIWGNKRGV